MLTHVQTYRMKLYDIMHYYGNGEVQEVYNPKSHTKVKSDILVLKNRVSTLSTHGGNI